MIMRTTLWLALGAVLVTGCTSSVAGLPAPAEAPGPPPTSAGPSADVLPPPPPGPGLQVEAIRLAGATSLVGVLLPDRTETCNPQGPVIDAQSVEDGYFRAGTAASILDAHGFVAAWGICQAAVDGQGTLALTMEMSDPASAARAVDELVAAAGATDLQATTLPSGAAALTRTADGIETVQGWAAVGRMISYVYHDGLPGQAAAGADLVMADQTALLAAFTPTPQADVPALNPDPDGLKALTLDPPGDIGPPSGPFELESYIRLAIDPVREREVLAANGFVGMYSKQSSAGELSYAANVYGFPTSAQTNAAYVAFAELESTAFGGTPITVPSIPDAPCFAFDAGAAFGVTRFYQRCYVGYGSYLAGIDVGGVAALDDVTEMDRLLVAQRDLIDG